MRNITRTAAVATCLGAVLLTSAPTLAERKSPLEGQPAIRHRYEMRKGRFEFGPSVGFAINRSLRHATLFGAKLEYHFTDWLSLGAEFGGGLNYDTGLTKEIEGQCGAECPGPASKFFDGDPSTVDREWRNHKARFSDITMAGDIRVAFTPISGKMGIFSKLFVGYDLYAFAGVGLALMSNEADGIGDADAITEGFRIGPSFGFGMHLFFTHWMSLGVEIKDLIFSDNESGGDITRGRSDKEQSQNAVLQDSDDRDFINHWIVGVNLTFFLPGKVGMSR